MSGEAPPPPSYVKLSASSLYFPKPHNRRLMNTVTVQNVYGSDLLFKVKGVRPDPYNVRPKNDLLPTGRSVDIKFIRAPEESTTEKEGFRLEVAPLPAGHTAAGVQGSKDGFRTAWDAGSRTGASQKIFLSCVFQMTEAQLPSEAQVNELTATDGASDVTSVSPRGESQASVLGTSVASPLTPDAVQGGTSQQASKLVAASVAAANGKKLSSLGKQQEAEITAKTELSTLKSNVRSAKGAHEKADGEAKAQQNYAAELHSASSGGGAASSEVTKKQKTEFTIPASVVVLLMLISYGIGLTVRSEYGPANSWF